MFRENSPETLSPAHRRSAFAVVDPLYAPEKIMPPPDIRPDTAPWLYGEGELESWRLQELRRQVKNAELHVGYPGVFHSPAQRVWFRHRATAATRLIVRACGAVTIRLDRQEIYQSESRNQCHSVLLPDVMDDKFDLVICLETENDLPALLLENGPYSTAGNGWEWSDDEMNWQQPKAFFQTRSGLPPHRSEPETVKMEPVDRNGNIYDFGLEVFGRIVIDSVEKPVLVAGESLAEAENTIAAHAEQSAEIIPRGDGKWISAHPLAFRYVRTADSRAKIYCDACFYPVQYRGAFACSDEKLTRIWSHSAYTLRLCMQDFILDGIKRDRLPWVGDLMMSMMADAYAFGDAEIARRSLTVLGRAGISERHLNGIVDYSLWWIIAHDCFQRYFGDMPYLRREWPRLKAMLAELEKRCNPCGLLTVAEHDWLFIDWVKGDKLTALQVLWQWAQTAAVDLASRMEDHAYASYWRQIAEQTGRTLHEQAWDDGVAVWRGTPGDPTSSPSRHAHFLSVISGLARPEHLAATRTLLLDRTVAPVGTPYMSGFENIALCRLGEENAMIDQVKDYWGGMLERGATTFWEAYDPTQHGDDAYEFYRRPFGKSLCHAWSAGPAALLPLGLLGLKPLTDGWKRFAVAPRPASLTWLAATVPTPQGDITVQIEDGVMTLDVPTGTVAEWQGHELSGANRIELK